MCGEDPGGDANNEGVVWWCAYVETHPVKWGCEVRWDHEIIEPRIMALVGYRGDVETLIPMRMVR